MSETFEIILLDDASDDTSSKTFNISDNTICRVAGFTGRGTPEPIWSMEENLIDHGGYPTKLKFGPRRITLDLVWAVTSDSDAIARREKIYEIFRPWLYGGNNFTQKASLKITRTDSSVRQIDFVTDSIVDVPFDPGDVLSVGQRSSVTRVSLLCHDPMWYDPTAVTYNDGGSPSFTTWSPIDVTDTTADMWPVITVVGPATSWRFDLYGVGGSRSILFNASPGILASETITIDTRPFRRAITDQTGADRTDLLLTFQGLDNMRIYADRNADSATQYASSGASSTTGASDVSWQYYKRYIGI